MKQHTVETAACRLPYSICVSCQKCSSSCPANINIPEVLKRYERYSDNETMMWKMADRIEHRGQPIDCIECGACSSICPQKLDVKEMMRRLAMRQICWSENGAPQNGAFHDGFMKRVNVSMEVSDERQS